LCFTAMIMWEWGFFLSFIFFCGYPDRDLRAGNWLSQYQSTQSKMLEFALSRR